MKYMLELLSPGLNREISHKETMQERHSILLAYFSRDNVE